MVAMIGSVLIGEGPLDSDTTGTDSGAPLAGIAAAKSQVTAGLSVNIALAATVTAPPATASGSLDVSAVTVVIAALRGVAAGKGTLTPTLVRTVGIKSQVIATSSAQLGPQTQLAGSVDEATAIVTGQLSIVQALSVPLGGFVGTGVRRVTAPGLATGNESLPSDPISQLTAHFG
jgi:hypothetical protein